MPANTSEPRLHTENIRHCARSDYYCIFDSIIYIYNPRLSDHTGENPFPQHQDDTRILALNQFPNRRL